MRVLVVEDEVRLAATLQDLLELNGYTVDVCHDGESGLDNALTSIYDVILLDVMLPKRDGYQLVADLRSKGVDTPVLFLTARDSIADRVKGLDLGADDYLVKPFDFDELLARIRVLSRKRVGHKSNQFTVADLTLDVERRQVYRAGQEIRLLPKEFSILECLMRGKGNVLSRRQIEDSIWNYDDTPSSNNVDVYISKLRKKIDGDSPVKLLHTIRGVGWVLREDRAAALAGQDGKEV